MPAEQHPVSVPCHGEAKEEISIMASVGDEIDVPRNDIAVGPRHDLSLQKVYSLQPKSTP